MNKLRHLFVFYLSLFLLTIFTGQAIAGLKAYGPTDLVTTLPSWYQDVNNLPLQPCLDQNGMCLLPPPFDPAGTPPISSITNVGTINDANFPGESFYFSADALLTIEGGELAKFSYVLEAAFLAGVIPDTGIVFLRTDLQKMSNLTPNSTYRATHPYGQFEFTTDINGDTTAGGGVAIRQEDPAGTAADWMPPLMKSAAITNIGPFLTPADGVFLTRTVGTETHTYIGDPGALTGVPVTGSPTGTNYFKIERILTDGVPVTGVSWQTDLWFLAGRVFTGQIPSPMTIERVTYARDATSTQVDVFASALPTAVLSISGTGIPTPIVLTRDNPSTGKFFANIPGTSLPSGVTITNSLDVPEIPYPVTLVDEIIITQAFYNPVNRELLIKAFSRDKVSPPTLSVNGFAPPNTLDATGSIVLPLPVGAIPPSTIQVSSSYAGKATAPVTVVIPPPAPVAVDDGALTVKTVPVSVKVLANDTSDAGIDPATVVVVDQPASGATAVVNASGLITYTPGATFTGTETFTYTVKDIFGQISNTATVTITVHAPPVAGDDAASAVIGTTVNIDVIANDTATASSINSTTVNIVSVANCGTTTVLANGTVNFTAPATVPADPGTCVFSYVVSDTFVPAALSNVATVTVTITPPPAPVAADDTATTVTGSTLAINVIANDTSAVSTINPATIAVSASTGGTAAANLDGTVTYTPPATPGSYTFTYTVKDNAVPSLTSNTATVTVTVDQGPLPPVAVNDPAVPLSITMNSSAVIDLVANDTPSVPATINPATVAIASYPANGTVTVHANGSVTYVPTKGYIGTDSFSYTVKDSIGLQSNTATVSLTVTAPPQASAVTLTVFPATTQAVGSEVSFVAAASGGSGTYEYQYWLHDGISWSMVRDYSLNDIWKWDTTTLSAGVYTVQVTARSVGSTAPFDTFNTTAYTLVVASVAPPAATGATITVSPVEPQPAGTQAIFTAGGIGGSGTYEYEFNLHNGVEWTKVQSYSVVNKWVWNTTGATAGSYAVQVNVRSAGSTATYEGFATIGYTLTDAVADPAPATGATLVASPASPQPAGTSVILVASGTGGSGTYEYEFNLFNGVSWTKVQNYSPVNKWVWNTTGAPVGDYTIQVNVRSAGSTATYEGFTTIGYTVTTAVVAPEPATGAVIAASPVSSQPVGTSVVFTATGTGGSGTYEYEFSLFNGLVWTKVQSFSPVNTWVWNTSSTSAGEYVIQANVRSSGSSASFEGVTTTGYVLTPTVPPPAPATGAGISPSPASPQPVGTNVIFTGSGSGGSGTYEYEFNLNVGGTWLKVQSYSAVNTWIWNTTGVTEGDYFVQVNVRSAGSTATFESFATTTYTVSPAVTPPAPATGATISASPASPRPAGTQFVVFTAGGSGGSGSYEYEFWLDDGIALTKVQSYTTVNTFAWDTVALGAGTYTVQVNVRSVGSAAASEATANTVYEIPAI